MGFKPEAVGMVGVDGSTELRTLPKSCYFGLFTYLLYSISTSISKPKDLSECCFKNGNSQPLFVFRLLITFDSKFLTYILPMTEFELQTSGVESDHS